MQMSLCRQSWIKNELDVQIGGDVRDLNEIGIFKTVETTHKTIRQY